MKFLAIYLFYIIISIRCIFSQKEFPLFGSNPINPGELNYINITSLDIGYEIFLLFHVTYYIADEISINDMSGNFGYSNKLPTFSESFYIYSDAGYSSRSLLYITQYFYFSFYLKKRYSFFLFNMKGINDYKGSIGAEMEKISQEFPFNEEKTVKGSTALFLSLRDIKQVNLQFSFISSKIYDSFKIEYLCSSRKVESSFSNAEKKYTIDLNKKNNKYTFCSSLPSCAGFNYLLFKPQSIDGDNNINIKTIDICPHAIKLYGNATFVEDGKIYFYLDIFNYRIGDNIYLQFIFKNWDSKKINSFLLYYKYSDNNYIDSFKDLDLINITTYVYDKANYSYIFYDSLKVKENSNYILFYVEYHSFYSPLTVKHTKTNEFLKKEGIRFIVLFIIILSAIVFILIIVIIICFVINKNLNKKAKLLEAAEKEKTIEIKNKIDNFGIDEPTPFPIDINMSAPPSITNVA